MFNFLKRRYRTVKVTEQGETYWLAETRTFMCGWHTIYIKVKNDAGFYFPPQLNIPVKYKSRKDAEAAIAKCVKERAEESKEIYPVNVTVNPQPKNTKLFGA